MAPLMTMADVKLFAYRQGPWRGRLDEFSRVDDSIPTTASVPPAAARGPRGTPLPTGTFGLLTRTPYPRTPALPDVPSEDRLGHLLVTALGLQRRELSNRFNDHRTVASVRSKYPVHTFVLGPDGSFAYLDLYRHALVALPGTVTADSDLAVLLPAPGDVTVMLAARFTDLPTQYGVLRCPLSLLEQGFALRSLHVAADLLDVRLRLRLDGAGTSAAGRLLAGTGPGVWSPPLVITVEGAGTMRESELLSGASDGDVQQYAEEDAQLAEDSQHASVREAAEVTAPLMSLSCVPEAPVRGIPELPARNAGSAQLSWGQALWNRTAGRVPAELAGFSGRPDTLGEDCLNDMLAWLGQPAPSRLLAEVGGRVRTTVALQRLAGLATGRYTLVDGRLELDEAEPGLMQRLQDGFGYPLTPFWDCGLRHTNATWVFSADVDAILDEFGPTGWALLQLWCGWASHGLTSAAAAHGLFARPARSFEEFRLQHVLGLPREQVPVFTVTCGRSRFMEPTLDLRT